MVAVADVAKLINDDIVDDLCRGHHALPVERKRIFAVALQS